MKRIFSFCVMFLIIPSFLMAQTGKVFDNLTLKSKILNMDRKFSVYLPSDYETSSRSYPVLYLLHGSGDDQTGWVQFGEVNYIADKAIKEGKSTAMIIVMPDAQKTQVRWYIDCGDDDSLSEGNSLLHIAMRKKEIPHEFRVRDGAHNWSYWREALPEVMDYISMGFHRSK